jgi:hypothetical protein
MQDDISKFIYTLVIEDSLSLLLLDEVSIRSMLGEEVISLLLCDENDLLLSYNCLNICCNQNIPLDFISYIHKTYSKYEHKYNNGSYMDI